MVFEIWKLFKNTSQNQIHPRYQKLAALRVTKFEFWWKNDPEVVPKVDTQNKIFERMDQKMDQK